MREDVHRPAEFVPEDYVCAGYLSHASSDMEGMNVLQRENRIRLLQLIQNSKTTAYHDGHQCDHCGAHLTYVAVFQHMPTGDFLAVGETCAEGRFEYSKAEFDRMRKEAQLDREKQRVLTAWNEFKAAVPVDWDALAASENSFVVDVLRKGRMYGSLSERQVESIVKAVARDAEYAERKANEVEAPKMAVPVGKQVVEGAVVSMRWQESQYGSVHKMLVLVEGSEGQYKLWGSVPKSLEGEWGCAAHNVTPEQAGEEWFRDGGHRFNCAQGYINAVGVGDKIKFSATLEASADDPFFGFFKRPTKGEILGAQYKCDECDATVVARDADGAVGWYFDEDAYLCPTHRLDSESSIG